jgi:hypothetical protein
MPVRVFRLRRDAKSLVNLIMAVPSDWAWLDGVLWAPRRLLETGQALDSVGLKFSRFVSGGVRLMSNCREMNHISGGSIPARDPEPVPDLKAVFIEQRHPGWVQFDEVGYFKHDGLSLLQFKYLAAGYAALGYQGWLHFYSGCYRDNKFDSPERCQFQFSDKPVRPGEHENYSLSVTHNPEFGGKEERLALLLERVKQNDLIPLLS